MYMSKAGVLNWLCDATVHFTEKSFLKKKKFIASGYVSRLRRCQARDVQYTFGTKGLNPFNSYQLQLNIISNTMLIFDKYISISAN